MGWFIGVHNDRGGIRIEKTAKDANMIQDSAGLATHTGVSLRSLLSGV